MNQANPTATPLAIVGIDCLFPKAGDKATFWTNLRDGVDAPPSGADKPARDGRKHRRG